MTQQNLRNYPTEELIKLLGGTGLSSGRELVIVDELIQRGVPLPISFNRWMRVLNSLNNGERKYIQNNFESFSAFTLFALQGKPFSEKMWFVSVSEDETQALDLSSFVKAIIGADELKGYYWIEGREQWTSVEKLSAWKTPSEPSFAPEPRVSEVITTTTSSSGMRSVLLAVTSFLLVPGWLILLVAAIVTGFGSFMGPLLPAVFSIFMILISIPMGIGLLQKKKWAWGMLIATTGFALFWFAGHFFFDHGSQIWIGLALFEAIILTLALTAKEQFA